MPFAGALDGETLTRQVKVREQQSPRTTLIRTATSSAIVSGSAASSCLTGLPTRHVLQASKS